MDRSRLLTEVTTEFGAYRVLEMEYNDRPARVLFNRAGMSAQSGMPLDGSPRMLFDYNQRFMEQVEVMRPASILVLGGGVYTFPTAVRKLYPDIALTVVERDGGLDRIAADFFDFRTDDPRLSIVHDDARAYLERKGQKFDLVVVDVFDDNEVPTYLINEDAAKLLAQVTGDAGAVVMNIIGALRGPKSQRIRSFSGYLTDNFAYVDVAPAGPSWTWWGSQNLIMKARKYVR